MLKTIIVAAIIVWNLMFGIGLVLSCALDSNPDINRPDTISSGAAVAEENDLLEKMSEVAHPSRDNFGYFDSLTLYWENDLFAGTDRDYTNGLKLTWSTPYGDLDNTSLPTWSYPMFNWLPFVNQPGGKRAITLAIGQDIFTPEDTVETVLIVDDRPYAGRTYLAAGFHTRRAQRKDSWEISIGMVGPASLAKHTQDLVHDIVGSERAQGWANQLNNELTVDAICESKWRLWSSSRKRGVNFDLIPHLGGRIGTVKTHLNAGAEFRVGWKLPNDFGSCPIRAGCETNSSLNGSSTMRDNFHFFLAADGKALVRDIFLDGNNFTDSHGVDKRTFVGELMGGFVWQRGRFKTTYSYIYRTKQFESQGSDHIYGSLSLTWEY